MAITAIIFAVIIVFTFVSGLGLPSITCSGAHRRIVGARHLLLHPGRTIRLADAISANWVAGDFMSQGFVGALPGMKLTSPSVFNFIICFCRSLVWGNNYYWMKVANCRSEKVARRSSGRAIVLIVVCSWCRCASSAATWARSIPSNSPSTAVPWLPTGTYAMWAKTFVSLFGSLVVISAVAASISTASTSAPGRLRCGQPRYLPAPDQPQG